MSHSIPRVFALILVSATIQTTCAQSSKRPTSSNKSARTKLVQFDKSVRALERAKRESIKKAEDEYDSKFEKLRDGLLKDFEKLMTAETKKGDLDTAIELRELIAYFRKLRRADTPVINTQLAAEHLAGNWKGKWITTGRDYDCIIGQTGKVKDWKGIHNLYFDSHRLFLSLIHISEPTRPY